MNLSRMGKRLTPAAPAVGDDSRTLLLCRRLSRGGRCLALVVAARGRTRRLRPTAPLVREARRHGVDARADARRRGAADARRNPVAARDVFAPADLVDDVAVVVRRPTAVDPAPAGRRRWTPSIRMMPFPARRRRPTSPLRASQYLVRMLLLLLRKVDQSSFPRGISSVRKMSKLAPLRRRRRRGGGRVRRVVTMILVDNATAAAASSSSGGVGIIMRCAMTANDVVVRGSRIAGIPVHGDPARIGGHRHRRDRTRAARRGGGRAVAWALMMMKMMGRDRGVLSGAHPTIHDGRAKTTGMTMGTMTVAMMVDADEDGGRRVGVGPNVVFVRILVVVLIVMLLVMMTMVHVVVEGGGGAGTG